MLSSSVTLISPSLFISSLLLSITVMVVAVMILMILMLGSLTSEESYNGNHYSAVRRRKIVNIDLELLLYIGCGLIFTLIHRCFFIRCTSLNSLSDSIYFITTSGFNSVILFLILVLFVFGFIFLTFYK